MENFAFILLAVFGIVLVLFFVMMGYTLKSRLAAYKTGATLAQELNLTSVSQARKPSLAWFQGTFQGRPFALRIIGIYTGRGMEGRRTYSTVLRLALTVNTKQLPGFKAKYDKKNRLIHVYDVRGELDNEQAFNERSSDAFWAFVQKGYSIGYNDGDLRFSRGTRELVFGERNPLDKEFLFGKTVLPDSPVVLVHDHIRPNRTADQVQELLAEMVETARVLEEDL